MQLNDIPVDYEHFLTIIEACNNGDELAAIQGALDQEISLQRSKDTGGEDGMFFYFLIFNMKCFTFQII